MKDSNSSVRAISGVIKEDLEEKMVLLAGPRQCGKTTLANQFIKQEKGKSYNWDIDRDRKDILKKNFDHSVSLWVFDEIHKYRRWKNWLKGVYDEYNKEKNILVTGSARLNIFKKGGDSLQGRYYSHRLHPFTIAELSNQKKIATFEDFEKSLESPLDWKLPEKNLIQTLLKLSGFPEPFLKGSEQSAKRWRLSYGQRLVSEDLRQLYDVKEIERIELLYDRLPEVVTSSLTIKKLAFDLEVAFETAKSWIEIFENLYSCFRIPPFGLPKIEAIKKQQKVFLWDWSRIDSSGPILENLVGLHLLRLVHWAEDVWGEKLELRYYRDQQQREVDFLILRKREPFMAVEVKNSQTEIDNGISYLSRKVKIPHIFQIHLKSQREYQGKIDAGIISNIHKNGGSKIWMMSVERFLNGLV